VYKRQSWVNVLAKEGIIVPNDIKMEGEDGGYQYFVYRTLARRITGLDNTHTSQTLPEVVARKFKVPDEVKQWLCMKNPPNIRFFTVDMPATQGEGSIWSFRDAHSSLFTNAQDH
jgi:hypothetical protein